MTVRRCANCAHPIYAHEPRDLELCREKDCPCPGFLTPQTGQPSALARAVEMVRFAHDHHVFGPEHCTPANCSVAEFLASLPQSIRRAAP